MRRALLTIAAAMTVLTGAITVLPAIASPLFGPVLPKCRSLVGDHVVVSSRQLTVYRGLAPGRLGTHDWVCAGPRARATALGADPGTGRFPAGETISLITAAGPWVAAVESSRRGFRACPPAGHEHCPAYHHQVQLIEADGASSSSTESGATVVALRLSSIRRAGGTRIGAAVWLQRVHGSTYMLSSEVDVVHAHSAGGGGGMVARGRIAPRSVRLAGLRVRFVENGKARSVRLSVG